MKRKIFSLIPFLIIATLLILIECSACSTWGSFILIIFLGIIYLIFLLIQLIIGIISHKGFYGVNYYPLIFTIFFVAVMFYKMAYKSMTYDSDNDILIAYRQIDSKKAKGCKIELMLNNRYKITKIKNVELRCAYYGGYRINDDTLILDNNVQELQDYIYGNVLMIDRKRKVLKPLKMQNDSIYWFKIDKYISR